MEENDKNLKEKLYDKIPISLKSLDIIIAALVVLLVIFLLLGYLDGNGFF